MSTLSVLILSWCQLDFNSKCWISITGFRCWFHSDRISPGRVAATCRSHVIYALPRLKCMDFSAVTPQERVMARYWHQGLQTRRTTEDPDDL